MPQRTHFCTCFKLSRANPTARCFAALVESCQRSSRSRGIFPPMLNGNSRPKVLDFFTRPFDAIVVVIALLAFSFAAHNAYSGLGQYGDWYDQGVYLESARLMSRGYRQYTEIFASQPPLWLPAVSLSFHVFGENLLAAQILTATSGLVILVAVMLAAGQVSGRGSGVFAGLLIVLSPTELEWSRVVVPEVPFAALAAIGMALAIRYVRNGNRIWLIAAACAIACSILIKVLGLFVLPSLDGSGDCEMGVVRGNSPASAVAIDGSRHAHHRGNHRGSHRIVLTSQLFRAYVESGRNFSSGCEIGLPADASCPANLPGCPLYEG